VLLSALPSCQLDGASLEAKNRSFDLVAGEAVDGVPLADFLAARTLRLLIDPEQIADSEDVYCGGVASATPITADGYMLTAAHAAETKGLEGRLLVQLSGSPRAHRVRVVWSGFEDEDTRVDMALLHVSPPPDAWFELAPEGALEEGQRVVCAGFSTAQVTFASGKLEGELAMGNRLARTIIHSTPLRSGDSGGPLITLDGRLVAVNASGHWSPLGGVLVSRAVRPNRDWLDGLIERDRRGR